MKRWWPFFSVCFVLIISIACLLVEQPKSSSGTPSVQSTSNNNEDTSNLEITVPNNEVLAYILAPTVKDPSKIKLDLSLANPAIKGWNVCLTCEIPGGILWDASRKPRARIAWSPDHTKIAFLVARADNQNPVLDLYLSDIGGNVKLLKTWETFNFPDPLAWSPDSRYVLVAFFTEEYDTGLHIVDSVTGKEKYLSIFSGGSDPVWLDNQNIGYFDYDTYSIFSVNLKDAKSSPVINFSFSVSDTIAPVWSPSGKQIIIQGYVNEVSGKYVVDTNGNVLMKLEVGDFDDPESISWSADGKKIVFTEYSSDGGYLDVYVVDLKTKELTRLTSSPDLESNPTWSPINEKIAFYKIGGIFTMNSDGTDQFLLVPLPHEEDGIVVSTEFPILIWK